ncbi:MAG TPA: (2Fe-2S) ferredoxin domain-containing protein [Methylophilaceae bacterium]|nr:(2Fe-2S) ferredoxin domain-containing protein [Methylophilaceae bacterium]
MTTPKKVLVCVNYRANQAHPSCAARGSEAIADALEQALSQHLPGLKVERLNCLGQCGAGPNVRLSPAGPWYHQLTLDDIPMLVAETVEFSKR